MPTAPDRHSRYLVNHDGPCMEIFDGAPLPKVGAFRNGTLVTGMTALRLAGNLYVVDVQTCEPEVVTHATAAPDAKVTLPICEVRNG